MSSVADRLRVKLEAGFRPHKLEIVDDSHRHKGHAGARPEGESHFTVVVESPRFAGLNRVARQRLVNQALADLLSSRIHALAIRARATGET